MLATPKTFNGATLNGNSIQTTWINYRARPQARNVFLEQSMADSVDAGTYTVGTRQVLLWVRVLNYANRYALMSSLANTFRRGTRGSLVVTFSDDNLDYQLDCRVTGLVPGDEPGTFTAVLESGNTDLRAVDLSTDTTWSPSGTGGTHNITTTGDARTRLSATVRVTTPPVGGYLYGKLYELLNSPAIAWGLWPWCITIDHAALVAAGKSQADGDDLRIFDRKVELRRWFADLDTDHTKVWFNLYHNYGYELTLVANVAGTGEVTALSFGTDVTTAGRLNKMPASGLLTHGSEWFSYSSRDSKTGKVYISQREAWGTTMQAHNIGDKFYFVEHPVEVLYGNSGATDPADDDINYDDTKPVFDLSASDNTKWVYDDGTLFRDPAHPNRPGQWVPMISKSGDVSRLYDITEDGATGDPALGVTAGSFLRGTAWQSDPVKLGYTFYTPGGIAKLSNISGQKYRSTNRWIISPIVGLGRSTTTSGFISVFNEATPASEDTWTPWTQTDKTFSQVKLIFFGIQGTYLNMTDGWMSIELLTGTVEHVTTYLPVGTLKAEHTNCTLACIMTNNNNGDSMQLVLPMEQNKDLVIDGENFTVTYDGINAHGVIALDDESRADGWIRLEPDQVNEIEIAGAVLGTLDVDLSHYERRS
jgi:hypothetical protein